MLACGTTGEVRAEPDGGGMVDDVLRDDAVDALSGALVCTFGDGGTEFRSGGIFESYDIGAPAYGIVKLFDGKLSGLNLSGSGMYERSVFTRSELSEGVECQNYESVSRGLWTFE